MARSLAGASIRSALTSRRLREIRENMRRSILRWFGRSLVFGALAIIIMVRFFGLRVEVYGAGNKPHFYFFKPEKHFAELEANRAQQKNLPVRVDVAQAAEVTPAALTEETSAEPAPKPVSTAPL